MEKQFKDLYEQINVVQSLIDKKKEERDTAILNYGNQIFAELSQDLNDKLAALDKAFPFSEMKTLGLAQSYGSGYRKLFNTEFYVRIDIFNKKIEYGYYKKDSSIAYLFRPTIDKVSTYKQNEGYSLSPTQYEKFFKDENPYVLFSELFDAAVNKLFEALKEKMRKKQIECENIYIPSFNFMKKTEEEKTEDDIVIGEYGKYKVVLQRK